MENDFSWAKRVSNNFEFFSMKLILKKGFPKRAKIDKSSLLNPMILNVFISKMVILEQKALKA